MKQRSTGPRSMTPRSTHPRRTDGDVRIIGGNWRGTRLPVPDLPGLRPTSDRVRETLFNWLQPRLPGARVLDLFAGSGALGLEALSRGAREALLVERDPQLVENLHTAVERLKARDAVHVLHADALAALRVPLHGRFDVVFVDPPFEADLWGAVLALLPPWLADDAWLYLESPPGSVPTAGDGWVAHREGATREVSYALHRRVSGATVTLMPGSGSDGAATE